MKKKRKLKSIPSYNLYIKLWYILDAYLMTRIDTYIFFEYYKWDIPESILIGLMTKNDINILKKIMEYDYEVFKVILYLYWDLEYYLEGIDGVKNSLIVDSIDSIFIKIKFSNKVKNYKNHIDKMYNQKLSYFWADIEIYGLLKKILKYDYFFNFDKISLNINIIEKYKKFNEELIVALRVILYRFNKEKKINLLYYESYIDKWYKEWFSELSDKKTIKYKKKSRSWI